jgi:hypothetical protein
MRVWGLRPQRVQGRALALPKAKEEKVFFTVSLRRVHYGKARKDFFFEK